MWNKCFHKVIQHLQVLIEGFDQPNQWQYEQHEKTMANSRRFPWFWIPITNGILWSWSWKILPKKTPRRGLTITRAINDLGGIILHFFSLEVSSNGGTPKSSKSWMTRGSPASGWSFVHSQRSSPRTLMGSVPKTAETGEQATAMAKR